MRRFVAGLVACTLALVAGAGPGRAQESEGAGSPLLTLAAAPAWIETGAAASYDLTVGSAPADAELVVTVHRPLTSRTAFERVLSAGALGAELGSVTIPLASLAPGPVGTHRLTLDLATPPSPSPGSTAGDDADPDAPAPDDADPDAPSAPPLPNIPISGTGVHPLRIDLRSPGGDTPLASLSTFIVTIDEDDPPARLAVAWVWPLEVAVPRRPDGSVAGRLAEAVAPDGRVANITAGLTATPGVPVTVAPTPATLEAWAELATSGDQQLAGIAAPSLETLRAATADPTRQVVAGGYSRPDITALRAAGLRSEIPSQLARGADVVRDVLGVRPDPRIFISETLDDDSLTDLRQGGVDRLVVRRDVLVPVFSNLTPARPFEIRSGGRTFLAVSADPGLSDLFAQPARDATASDAERAQRLLAGLALVSLEAPGEERGLVLVPPLDWRPSPDLLVSTLRGLAEHAALRPVTLDQFFSEIPPAEGEAAVRTLEANEPGRLAVDAEFIRRTRAQIRSLASLVPETDPLLDLTEQMILVAESEVVQRRGASPSAGDYLRGVDDLVRGVLESVRLPREPGVTLTARQGDVPVTFVNDSDRPLRVRVRLVSEQLLFPDGDTHEIELPPRSTTAQFTVEARTSGSFPMTVEVTSPDGLLEIGTFRMSVRSTAVSGVALALTVGAGVFLLGWWGNHIRRSRQIRRDRSGMEQASSEFSGDPEGPA